MSPLHDRRSRTGSRLRLENLEDRTVPSFAFDSAFGIGSTAGIGASGIVTDNAGDVYIAGSFQGTADFDPGPGTFNLVSGTDSDAFVAKYSAVGSFVWAVNLTGTEGALGIAVDDAGNVYATGAGDQQREGFGDGAFVVKLDASSGALIWTREVGNTWGRGVAADSGGNVYVVGQFYHSSQYGSTTLSNPNTYQGFVTKLDAAGNFLWAKAPATVASGGSNINADPEKIALDGSGNAYITGRYYGTQDFDPGTGSYNLTSMGGSDIIVWKLDTGGDFAWARSMGSVGNDGSPSLGGIALDGSGNVIVAGPWSGDNRNDFDPGPGTLRLTRSDGGYVVKLNANGDLVWGRSLPARVRTVAVDSSSNVYTTGEFTGSVDFDPGKGKFILTSAGSNDVFVSKLTSAGNFADAANLGGTGFDRGHAIAVDSSNNVYTTGVYTGPADFDPGPGTYNLTGGGVFVSKLTQSGTLLAFGGSALMSTRTSDSTAAMPLAPIGLDGSFALFGRFIFDPTLDTLKDVDPLNN